ncbi:hypothetical protein T310_3294 [Rasamsonia emersonii CBS 393.64]|uniref:Uncharacterized protein n=1 Tax=Rasamsonia emersonii (strain ATCC 16479 / CBS 393.64 / IMI 116815) TaxID=1408163 RepID=A0A0F4YX73_RASE3|nr:hypothetical protein T310_3294 [Rasamsonia emersonii CBS 393.64]KKA22675.1 hypothetical protein T310_3294 [Rasamsonia emersonii CBS 393.64]
MKFFERIEHALEQRNRYDWATSLRDFESHFVSAKRKRAQGDWIRKQNAERRKEFSLLQREIYLKEEVAAYEKQSQIESLTEDKAKTLEKWKKELETFDEQLWLHKRAIYTAELNKPKGPWIRTWEASINDAVLYGEKAKLLCKANGGCFNGGDHYYDSST